jgi:hypothetical protein
MFAHRYVLRVPGVRRVILRRSRCVRQSPPTRGPAQRRILQPCRDFLRNRPIQLRLFSRILLLHHDIGISMDNRIFATFLRSFTRNYFNFPFRSGISSACIVYNLPD